MAGKATPATTLLASRGIAHRLHSYPHGIGRAYGPEAADLLGLDPSRVFKTLVAEVDGALTVGVVPVSATLDLKALAVAVGGKRARMAEVTAAERVTGYVAGGISPLGQRRRLPTVLDASAQQLETMFCSAGRRGLEVELAPADLALLTGGRFAPIAGCPIAGGWAPTWWPHHVAGVNPLPAARVHPPSWRAWLGRSPNAHASTSGPGALAALPRATFRRSWSGPSTACGSWH